ncbi:site-2 protease family protein [Candidatus Saccharibacteria bacterium CPR2]|nr:site-2 protease family protein [Candidatus Saccharibacteria bacterium CPR2]
MQGEDVLIIVMMLFSILFSMTLHEAMHAFTSHWLGDDTAYHMGRLTLNPLAHIDLFTTVLMPILLFLSGLPPIGAAKPVPFNPSRLRYDEFGAALVGVAGPLTNLGLAVFAGLWLRFVIGLGGSETIVAIFTMFIYVNLSFFVFNMIPYPPLDGSRVLYAFAPEPLQNFMRQIESFGIFGIIVFILVIFQFVSPIMVQSINYLFELIVGGSVSF